jgi:CBS domain-containing protein
MLRDVCTKPVVTVTAETPIREAARLMQDKNNGSLVVASTASGRAPTSATSCIRTRR